MSESPRRPGLLQEDDRVSGRRAGALIVAVTLFTAAAIWWATSLGGGGRPFSSERTPPRTQEVRDLPTVGRVSTTLIAEDSTAERLRERRRAALDEFGWVDAGRGLVRIPITAAMRLVAERSGPAAAEPADSAAPESAP